jgi:hypothetical protein
MMSFVDDVGRAVLSSTGVGGATGVLDLIAALIDLA